MKPLEMLDPTMLMIHGLMDHPYVIDLETKRLQDLKDEAKIKALIDRCMKDQMIREALLFDEDLAEALVASAVAEMKGSK